MTRIDAILCAVDQSESSDLALTYAVKLAERHGARLHLIEVAEPEAPEPDESRLRERVSGAAAEGVTVDVHVRNGNVTRQILAEADAQQVNLIVVGSHGRSGFERLMLGSVTSRLLHMAKVPVLVVPHASAAPDVSFDTVVCATDFSSTGNAALTFARAIAEPGAHAELILLHVVEWPFGDATGEDAIADLRRSLEAQAQTELEHLAAMQALVEPAPDVQVVVVAGKPSREIAAAARARDADLIVMGVTGRGAIDLALLGSTTFQVLRYATCPVVTVPHLPALS